MAHANQERKKFIADLRKATTKTEFFLMKESWELIKKTIITAMEIIARMSEN